MYRSSDGLSTGWCTLCHTEHIARIHDIQKLAKWLHGISVQKFDNFRFVAAHVQMPDNLRVLLFPCCGNFSSAA